MHKLRHLRAILTLPFVALCVIPGLALSLLYNVDTRWNTASAAYGIIFFAGIVFLLAGMILLVVTVYLFATVGEGTLAPWRIGIP